MKKILSILLAVMLCCGAVCCLAEPLTETEEKTAVLSLSSFGGGGPEYTITIDDPQIVSSTCRREYEDPEFESIPGASYNNIYTFTGLKPGTTEMTVTMSSPLMDGYDSSYTVVVGDDLKVTLNLNVEKAISRFELSRNGEIAYDSYEIVTLMDQYSMSVNGDYYKSIDDEPVDALFQVVEKYDLYKWDGFQEFREDVLDGEGFRLEIIFTDGTHIYANGDNAFPENYFAAIGEMQEILENIETENRELIVGTDIDFEDMTDFYYTIDASYYPPEYQRYRFYVEDGKHLFFHETRKGENWPQTEEDTILSGTKELTADEWEAFLACVEGGTVRAREESLEDGDSGPWMYLYWNGDGSVYQEFYFASWDARTGFEELCETLRDST